MTAKRDFRLSQASAYWRLAAKAERAGQDRQADLYRKTGNRIYREYERQREHLDRQFGARTTP